MSEKEDLTPMSLINYRLRRMNWGGYNPKNRTTFRRVLGFFIWFIMLVYCILQCIFLLTHKYNNSGFVMIDVLLFIGNWQMVIKLWTLFTQHEPFLKLIDKTEQKFWSLDVLSLSDRPDIQSVYNIAKLATNSYTVCITLAAYGHGITAYFRGKENLFFNIWMPDNFKEWNRTPWGHHIIFAIQVIIFQISMFAGLSEIDGLYITLIALVIGQLKIMKCKLMGLSEEKSVHDNLKEISNYTEHHNLLFDYLQTIEEIFSIQLLNVAGTIIIIIVISMYISMLESDVTHIMTMYIFCVTMYSLLFIYCFMGQLIEDETLSVADVVYLCKWENIPDKNVRFSLLLMILRSQKYFNFTLGGFSNLNLEMFTQVSRMMLSLLMFMKNLNVGK